MTSVRDEFCITWLEQARILQGIPHKVKKKEEKKNLTHSDNIALRLIYDMKKLVQQQVISNIFNLHITLNEEGTQEEAEKKSLTLVLLVIKDRAPVSVVTCLTAMDRGKQRLLANAKQR